MKEGKTRKAARKTAAGPSHDQRQRVVAVTGSYSFLGSQLIQRLEADLRYAKILAIDIRKPSAPLDKTQFHRVDLTLPTAGAQLAALLRRENVDTLVHAALLSHPTHNRVWAHELESVGTMHVLNACHEVGLRKFILWSMTALYGPHPLNPNFIPEEHELRGVRRSRFLRDKIDAEMQVRRFRDENPGSVVTVLRAAPVLGPRIRNLITVFFARPLCPVLMGHDPLLQFLHEDDFVAAFKLVVDEDHPGAFNIAADGVLPYRTVLAMMGKVPLPVPHFLASPIVTSLWATQIVESPPMFLDFLRYLCVADLRKAKQELGFQPVHDVISTIHHFLGLPASAFRRVASPPQEGSV